MGTRPFRRMRARQKLTPLAPRTVNQLVEARIEDNLELPLVVSIETLSSTAISHFSFLISIPLPHGLFVRSSWIMQLQFPAICEPLVGPYSRDLESRHVICC